MAIHVLHVSFLKPLTFILRYALVLCQAFLYAEQRIDGRSQLGSSIEPGEIERK